MVEFNLAFFSSSENVTVKTLLKSAHIYQSYCKKNLAQFFGPPCIYFFNSVIICFIAPPACSLLTIFPMAQMHKLYILYFSISCILPVVTTVAVFPTVLSCVAVVCYTIIHVIVYVTFAAVCLRLQ